MVDRPTLSPDIDLQSKQGAWVVFSDKTDIAILKLLRRGFRHCFMIMQQDGRWILIDPRANKTDIALLPHPRDFNFPRYYMNQGMTVVKVPHINTPHKILSPFPVTCIAIIKRIIGLHKWSVITPYHLYKTLQKMHKLKGS